MIKRRKSQLDEHYRREKERAILNKRLDQRKNMLQARQKWMDRAFSDAFEKLTEQPLEEYKGLVINLITKVSRTNDEDVVFGKKGDAKFLEGVVAELNKKTKAKFSVSKKRGDFPWGFILKKEKVEILRLMTIPMRFLGYPEESLNTLQEGGRLAKDINDDKSQGRCGFVYEEGSNEFRRFDGNHIHIPSDYRILNSPEYMEWFWICI